MGISHPFPAQAKKDDERDLDEAAGALLVELNFGNPRHEATVKHGLLCLLAPEAPTPLRLLAARAMNAGISTDSPHFVSTTAAGYGPAFVPSLLHLVTGTDALLAYEAAVVVRNLLHVDNSAGQFGATLLANFKGASLCRFPLVLADFSTSDHLSERSRSMNVASRTRARGTAKLKRR